MGTEATERGHFRELQVMVFDGVADLILCRLADASGHHAHFVSVGHVRPLARDGGGVRLSVDTLSFSPGDLQTFAHQDFRHLAPHVSRRRFADGPCPRHGLAHVVSLFHCFCLLYVDLLCCYREAVEPATRRGYPRPTAPAPALFNCLYLIIKDPIRQSFTLLLYPKS